MKRILIYFLMFAPFGVAAQYNCINWPYQISSVTALSSTSVVINFKQANPLVDNSSFNVGVLLTSISGYSNLTPTPFSQAAANKASITLTGLTPGAQYIFTANTSISCSDINPITHETINDYSDAVSLDFSPVQLFPIPNASAASAMTTTSFTANWQSVTGASSYRLDVSTDNFATTLPAYSNLAVSTTSQSVTGLSAGTTYQYRIRAVNATGTSSNSNAINALTLPPAPVLASVDNISSSGMRINWNSTTGASGYQVDVSTASNFSSLVSSSNITITGTSATVTGLSSGTAYYFRVRAVNGSGNSGYSTGNQITVSDAPSLLSTSAITTSSFTANWNASTGATKYRLDVSADNFATTLSSYTNLLVTSTSQIVSGLSAGTSYKFRVRAENASGTSVSSAAGSVITISPAPVLTAADNISTSGMRLNWNATTGATSYQVDVSTMSDFSTLISGTNISISGTSASVTGLTSGTVYYYRIRALNASGSSENSASSQITVSDAPAVQLASNITTTSFTVNWNSSVGADAYSLDLSTDNFATFITGFQNLPVTGTSLLINNLTPGTSYSFRVRAINAGGASANSDAMSQITLPSAPQNFATSNITATSLKVSWDATVSATEYQLQVSTTQDFSSLLTNYAPKVISSTLNEDIVVGLLPSTIYYLRIRAKNQAGLSEPSAIKVSNTLSSSGGNDFAIQLTEDSSNPDKLVTSQSSVLATIASGGIGAVTVTLFHRKNSEQNFSSETLTLSSGKYSINISDAWFDYFGLEYYFQVSDASGQSKQSSHHTILRGVSNVSVPLLSFGREIKNYQIISFPYTLENNQINNVMEKVMGTYDKKKWRFSQFKNGKIIDYQEGLAVSSFAQGESYFFISKTAVDLSVGQGYSFGNSISTPFKMTLKKGWNQVGNPFPYNLSWQSVLASNGNPAGVGKLFVFQQSSVSFVESDKLQVFGGGLVFAENDTEITFSTSLPVASGRIGSGSIMTSGNDDGWKVPIQLNQGQVESNLSGIGMSSLASDGKDEYDQVSLPAVLSYLQLSEPVPNSEFTLSRNIVPARDHHVWNFNVESDADDPIVISWSKEKVAAAGGQLILHDKSQNVLIDMAKISELTVNRSTKLSIYFEKQQRIETEKVIMATPFPNPFHDKVTIAFDYSAAEKPEATLFVYDLSGREIAVVTNKAETELGLNTITWNGNTLEGITAPAGLYIFKLVENSGNNTTVKNGKILKQ
ncbi:MAG: fibronectin type III domain-containing protein [Bacteroidetes bacterium]|nr:fibronectin type III domain-containing protein [Bacteroidota bacterium]